MSYGKIKTWIAAEVLTASDLNAEFSNNVTNENDLDSRVTTEVAARVALEAEFDALDTDLDSISLPANTTISAFGKTVIDDATAGDVRDTIGTPSEPAAGVAGLRKLGTGALHAFPGNSAIVPDDASVTIAKLASTVAGTVQDIIAQESEYSHNGTSYTKITEIRLGFKGTLRYKFHLRRGCTTGVAYGRIYKNGVAFGAEHSSTSSTGTYYQANLASCNAGDLIQLYSKQSTGSGTVHVKNLSLNITAPLKSIIKSESSN